VKPQALAQTSVARVPLLATSLNIMHSSSQPRKKKQVSKEPEAPQRPPEDQLGGRASDHDPEADKDIDRPHSAKGTRKRTKKKKAGSPAGSPIPPAEESESKVMDV